MQDLTQANEVYPGGLAALNKKAAGAYTQIGIAKCEWARLIGAQMSLTENASFFCGELDEEDRNGMKFLYSTLVLNHSDTIK